MSNLIGIQTYLDKASFDNKDIVYKEISQKVKAIHQYNYEIKNFRPENINYSLDKNEVIFNNVSVADDKDFVEKDLLLLAAFMITSSTKDYSFFNICATDKNQLFSQVENLYESNKYNLSSSVSSYFDNSIQNHHFDYYNSFLTKSSSNGIGNMKKKTSPYYKEGNEEIKEKPSIVPNAFVSMVLFPAVIFYLCLMVGLVYWIVALK